MSMSGTSGCDKAPATTVGPRGNLSQLAGKADCVTVAVANEVATITLARPGNHNALTYAMGIRLLDAVVRGAADRTVRCLLILGEGPSFCAGDDLASVDAWCQGEEERAPFDATTHDAQYLRVCEELIKAPKPVVLGLTGSTVGAGLDLACAADLRVAGESARFASKLVSVGHVGHAVLLPRLIGLGRATAMYFTGRFVGAPEALAIGLIDEVVPDADVCCRARELAQHLAKGPTRAMAYFKDLRERAWGQPVEAGLRMQDRCHLVTHDHVADSRLGIEAALSRTSPEFTGQ